MKIFSSATATMKEGRQKETAARLFQKENGDIGLIALCTVLCAVLLLSLSRRKIRGRARIAWLQRQPQASTPLSLTVQLRSREIGPCFVPVFLADVSAETEI